jgi:hypothetical protein
MPLEYACRYKLLSQGISREYVSSLVQGWKIRLWVLLSLPDEGEANRRIIA